MTAIATESRAETRPPFVRAKARARHNRVRGWESIVPERRKWSVAVDPRPWSPPAASRVTASSESWSQTANEAREVLARLGVEASSVRKTVARVKLARHEATESTGSGLLKPALIAVAILVTLWTIPAIWAPRAEMLTVAVRGGAEDWGSRMVDPMFALDEISVRSDSHSWGGRSYEASATFRAVDTLYAPEAGNALDHIAGLRERVEEARRDNLLLPPALQASAFMTEFPQVYTPVVQAGARVVVPLELVASRRAWSWDIQVIEAGDAQHSAIGVTRHELPASVVIWPEPGSVETVNAWAEEARQFIREVGEGRRGAMTKSE